MNAVREMPRYRCHKEVYALRIAKISGNLITPADDGYATFEVDYEWIRKHEPQPGGFYVVYRDGYKSYSPAEAFEDGYTRL